MYSRTCVLSLSVKPKVEFKSSLPVMKEQGAYVHGFPKVDATLMLGSCPQIKSISIFLSFSGLITIFQTSNFYHEDVELTILTFPSSSIFISRCLLRLLLLLLQRFPQQMKCIFIVFPMRCFSHLALPS